MAEVFSEQATNTPKNKSWCKRRRTKDQTKNATSTYEKQPAATGERNTPGRTRLSSLLKHQTSTPYHTSVTKSIAGDSLTRNAPLPTLIMSTAGAEIALVRRNTNACIKTGCCVVGWDSNLESMHFAQWRRGCCSTLNSHLRRQVERFTVWKSLQCRHMRTERLKNHTDNNSTLKTPAA